MTARMDTYVPVLILGLIAGGFAVFSVVMGSMTGPKRYNRAKYDSYECGIEPTPQPVGGGRFPVKYYLTAMLFIVFDIEIVFLYPWAVVFHQIATFGLIEVIVFAAVVFVSFIYLISNGALTWGPPKTLQSGMPSRTSESTITRISASKTPGEAA